MSELTKTRKCEVCGATYSLAEDAYNFDGARKLVKWLESGRDDYDPEVNYLVKNKCAGCAKKESEKILEESIQKVMNMSPFERKMDSALGYVQDVYTALLNNWRIGGTETTALGLMLAAAAVVAAEILIAYSQLPDPVPVLQLGAEPIPPFSKLRFLLTYLLVPACLPVLAVIVQYFLFPIVGRLLGIRGLPRGTSNPLVWLFVFFDGMIVSKFALELYNVVSEGELERTAVWQSQWIVTLLAVVFVAVVAALAYVRSRFFRVSNALIAAGSNWVGGIIGIVVFVYLFIPVGVAALITGFVAGSNEGAVELWKFNAVAAVTAPAGTIPVYGNYLHIHILERAKVAENAPYSVGEDGRLPLRHRVFGILAGIFGAMCAPALWFKVQEALGNAPGGVSLTLGLLVWIAGSGVSIYYGLRL